MNKVIRTPLNFKLSQAEIEFNNLPSETIPDQSLSCREILERFSQGRSVPINKKLTYTGDSILPDVDKLDLVDVDSFAENAKNTITESKSKLNEASKKRSEKRREAELAFLRNQSESDKKESIETFHRTQKTNTSE